MRSETRLRGAWVLLLLLSAWVAPSAVAADPKALPAADVEFFEKRVRPVLADRCFACHGSDNVESGLRVDSLAAILKGGTRGPALVPKEPKTSLMILAINHADQLHMPPKSKMPQREIDGLTEWVERGAFWPGVDTAVVAAAAKGKAREITPEDRNFWSLRPVVRPQLPAAKDRSWVRSPIDAFVLSRLEAAGVAPAPPASKRTLIRRATLDLTGLPPTPDEVSAFLADESPAAFERVVERLLASPRYGQRWGRHWLDVARYGDSNGLDENLAFGNAWRYRDYVIDAFNADLPYDQFLAEQVAGDLMPSDDPDVQRRRLAATGFLTLGAKMLAEDDPVKMEMDIIDEQVDTLGRAVLGLTLGCARCHDHKFDPILASDYYALAGIFKSTKTMDTFTVVARWQERPLATPSELRQRDAALAIVKEIGEEISRLEGAERERILTEVRSRTAAYLLAALREERLLSRSPAAERAPDGDIAKLPGAILIEAESFSRGNVKRDFDQYGKGIGVLVNKGETPNEVEYEVRVEKAGLYQLDLRYAAASPRPCSLLINGVPVRSDVAGRKTGGWHPDSQKWFIEGLFLFRKGKNLLSLQHPQFFPHIDNLLLTPAGTDVLPSDAAAEIDAVPLIPELVTLWRETLAKEDSPLPAWRHAAKHDDWNGFDRGSDPLSDLLLRDALPGLLELARRYASVLTKEGDAKVAEVRKRLSAQKGPWAPDSIPEIAYSREARDALRKTTQKYAEAQQAVEQFAEAMAVSEGKPTNLRIHLRGSHVTLGDATTRRFPVVLDQGHDPQIPPENSGRLQLARWLADPSNPLTARVIVNRLWQHHFGEGIVRSPDNFGRLGDAPTHPELLDWLASEIADCGLSIADSQSGGAQAANPQSTIRNPQSGLRNPKSWSLKRLHRAILLSSTWQQSTAWNERANEVDPENHLFWRMPRRRLEAEAIRDAILFVGGSLDESFGGSLLPTKNRAYVTSTANVNPAIYTSRRRTLYLPVVRSAVNDFLVAFDFGDPSTMQGKRDRTTVAPQALYLMNSAVVAEQSRALAERLVAASGSDEERVQHAFESLFSRPATTKEVERSVAFVHRYAESLPAAEAVNKPVRSWQAFSRALITSNEFLYLD